MSMYRWRAELDVWPHSTGNGGEADQQAAGGRHQTVEVAAGCITEALRRVELYQRGILTNPAVWQAPIRKLERIT